MSEVADGIAIATKGHQAAVGGADQEVLLAVAVDVDDVRPPAVASGGEDFHRNVTIAGAVQTGPGTTSVAAGGGGGSSVTAGAPVASRAITWKLCGLPSW